MGTQCTKHDDKSPDNDDIGLDQLRKANKKMIATAAPTRRFEQ